MTDDELQAIEARANAAIKGTIKAAVAAHRGVTVGRHGLAIGHAVADTIALVAEVKRLRAALDVVEAHATIETPDTVRRIVREALS